MKFILIKYLRIIAISILWAITTAIIAISIVISYNPEIQLLGVRIINPLYDIMQGLPFWGYIVLYFILFAILSVIAFISLSLYFDIQRKRDARIKQSYFRFFTYALTNLLIVPSYKIEENKMRLFLRIKPFLKRRIQVLALFDAYIRIQESVNVDLSHDFNNLITVLKLQRKLEALIHHRRFDDRILAMRVLSHLQIRTSDKQIFKYAQSSNFSLRTEAYASLVRLMQKDEYLVDFIGEENNLSILDVNTIVNAVLKNRKMDIKYKALMSSHSDQKVAIGQVLTKYRIKKNELKDIPYLAHIGSRNLLINKLAWEVILTLLADDKCIYLILEQFENEEDEIKLHILENSRHLKDQQYLDFLVNIMERQTLLVKIEAMKIIFNNDFDLLSRFTNSEDEEMIMAYKETSSMFING